VERKSFSECILDSSQTDPRIPRLKTVDGVTNKSMVSTIHISNIASGCEVLDAILTL